MKLYYTFIQSDVRKHAQSTMFAVKWKKGSILYFDDRGAPWKRIYGHATWSKEECRNAPENFDLDYLRVYEQPAREYRVTWTFWKINRIGDCRWKVSVRETHRAADISLYRTSISHLGVDFSFFSAQLESISPFALRLSAVIEYHSDVYERSATITMASMSYLKCSVSEASLSTTLSVKSGRSTTSRANKLKKFEMKGKNFSCSLARPGRVWCFIFRRIASRECENSS